MAQMTQFYNLGTWGYMGVGPTPSKSFTLTVSTSVGYSWDVPFEWEKIGILFYKIGDTTKYAVHKTATLDVVGGNHIVHQYELEQSVDITYNAEDWDFYGGFTASDLEGSAICFFTKEPAGISGSAPNGLDYASITDTNHIIFSYSVLPTRFANKIDGSDIYAKRAECDSDGNPIITTYATKVELAGKQDKLTAGENITIDSDGVISAAGGGGETYTAGSGINIDSDGEVSVKTGSGVTIDSDGALSAELPEEEPVQFEEFDDSDFATKAELAAKADSATTLAGYGITDAYTKTEVGNALANKADSATTLAGYGITDAYTKTQVDNALNGKQNSLTGITDVQVVQSLPASPVATVLYLIPEA